MRPLHQILPALVSRQRRKPPARASAPAPEDDSFAEDLIRSAWSHLAGKELAARTRPLRLYRGRLIVEVPERSWPRHLRRFEGAVLDRVNRLLGQAYVSGVEWRVNPALADQPPRKPPARETAQDVASDVSLDSAARSIGDPELRRLFLRTARKMAR